MSSLNWTRWSGPAAAAGGALMLAGVLQTVDPEHRVAQKLLWLWPAIPMLFLVAVAELFNRRYPGWLAKARNVSTTLRHRRWPFTELPR